MSSDDSDAMSTKNVLKHLLKEKNRKDPDKCHYCTEDNPLNLYTCTCGHIFCTLHVAETMINGIAVDTCPSCSTILDDLH